MRSFFVPLNLSIVNISKHCSFEILLLEFTIFKGGNNKEVSIKKDIMSSSTYDATLDLFLKVYELKKRAHLNYKRFLLKCLPFGYHYILYSHSFHWF